MKLKIVALSSQKFNDILNIVDIQFLYCQSSIGGRLVYYTVGTSNGAGMIWRLLIELDNPRPFRRVIPMVSNFCEQQHHEGGSCETGIDCFDN